MVWSTGGWCGAPVGGVEHRWVVWSTGGWCGAPVGGVGMQEVWRNKNVFIVV